MLDIWTRGIARAGGIETPNDRDILPPRPVRAPVVGPFLARLAHDAAARARRVSETAGAWVRKDRRTRPGPVSHAR